MNTHTIASDRLVAFALSPEELIQFINKPNQLASSLKISIPTDEPGEALYEAITQSFLPNVIDAGENYIFYTLWLIVLKENRQMAGSFCFHGAPVDGEVEIGYGINPDYQHRGYMSEMLTAIIKWAEKRNGIEVLKAETDSDNQASKRVLEKTGFINISPDKNLYTYQLGISAKD